MNSSTLLQYIPNRETWDNLGYTVEVEEVKMATIKTITYILCSIILVFATKRAMEGTIRNIDASFGLLLAKIGKVSGLVYSYRPNRLYFRLAVS
jgi:hypothetical protein